MANEAEGTCLFHALLSLSFSSIDEARGKNCGVLVHCLAGISRSVTVTVAYLMQKLNLSMNDAYDIVKMKKSNISPNFNFMGQLLDFERTLGLNSPCDNRMPSQQLYFTTPSNQNVFQVDSLQSTWTPASPHLFQAWVMWSFLTASCWQRQRNSSFLLWALLLISGRLCAYNYKRLQNVWKQLLQREGTFMCSLEKEM